MNKLEYDRYIQKRFGVSQKQLDEWVAEYKEDVRDGSLKMMNDELRLVNKFLWDVSLQRQYRRCSKYKKVDTYACEGTLRNGQKILIEKDPELRSDRYLSVRIYINNKMVYECRNQREAVRWLKEYFGESDAVQE
jgi:hypothetical protein